MLLATLGNRASPLKALALSSLPKAWVFSHADVARVSTLHQPVRLYNLRPWQCALLALTYAASKAGG